MFGDSKQNLYLDYTKFVFGLYKNFKTVSQCFKVFVGIEQFELYWGLLISMMLKNLIYILGILIRISVFNPI